MKKQYHNIRNLLSEYLEGKTTLEEEKQLSTFFTSEDVPKELEEFQPEFIHYLNFQKKEPQYVDLEDIVGKTRLLNRIINSNLVKIAAVIVIATGSFFLGTKTVQEESKQQIQVTELKNELNEMKVKMAGRLITDESSHEKIKGLMMANDTNLYSSDIISDILNIYEYDTNPIVRSMALDFLKNHIKNEEVRNAMIGVISKDDLIQIQLETFLIIKQLNDEELMLRLNGLIENDLLQEQLKSEIEELL